ncbi:hypothetical protein LTS02_008299 [Friedmanniomyces endolithicus]|nr:hypothetical protein LTS02_008299 [Friedmanniomyces endolithicus]
MDWGQTYRERGVTAQPHETVARDAGAPPSTQSHGAVEGAPPGSSHAATAQQRPSSSDVWAGALARLQTQVSLNTSMLESHRRQVGEVEEAVGRLQQEFGHVVAVIHEMRAELHARTTLTEQARHDSGDINVLASQVATVTDKANEVDGLKMQLELMKNRMKRFEDHAPPAARPGTSSARELYETAPMSSHSQTPVHAQHLPPMRNVSTYGPPADRSYGGPAPNVLPSQSHPSYQPRPDLRIPSNDQLPIQPAQAYAYRPADPLPPPSAPTGWRSADTHGPPQPQQQLETPVPFRPHASGQKHQPSGWAAVNANAAIKRPFEEHRQSPIPEAAKTGTNNAKERPRRRELRFQIVQHATAWYACATRRSNAVTQPSSVEQFANAAAYVAHTSFRQCELYRFITSTAEVDMQGGWKVEPESTEHVMPLPSPAGKGRGRGSRRRGGGRGRGSRRGAHHQLPASQEPSVTALQTADLTSTQVQPNDEEPPMAPTGDKPVPRPETSPTNPVDDFPATPILGRHHDTLGATQANPLLLSNSSKKSRSKPTRNADGVLIRKDGRPDMRSVSSANNLRRVHAQREAARGGEGEGEGEGRTPESGWEGSVGGEEGERGEGEVVMKEEDEEEGMDDEGRREGREAEGELSAARGLSDENGVREFRGGDARTAEQQRAGSTDVKMESAPVLSDREPAAVSGSEVQRETASEQSSEQSASLSAERSVASME